MPPVIHAVGFLRGYTYLKVKHGRFYLVRYSLSCLFGVMAQVDDIADLLAIHNKVDAICGQRQERVMDVMQLREGQAIKNVQPVVC